MNSPLLLLAALIASATATPPATPPAAPSAPAPRTLVGDAGRGAGLYRLHCASCHGRDGRGDGPVAKLLGKPAPTDLLDVAFLLQRSDDDLYSVISQGGRPSKRSFTMPAFGGSIGPLDAWDVVAHVRRAQPQVSDYFPEAARFTARTYPLEGDSLKRLEPLLGKLEPGETKIVLATVYGGEKTGAGEPSFVPHDPRLLDQLKPKQKQGYLSFGSVVVPGAGDVPVALAMDRDGVLTMVRADVSALGEKERAAVAKLLVGYEGQGGKKVPYEELKTPKNAAAAKKDKKDKKPAKKVEEPKEAPEVAKSLSRTYLRALEAATLYDKEDRERHWAD